MLDLFTPRLNVEIIYKTGDSRIKKCQIAGNRVIIEQKRRGRGGKGWSPTFDKACIIERKTRKLIFKRVEKRLMVMEGAEKCVNFAPTQKAVNIPTFDRKECQEFFDVSVLRQSGDVKIKHELPFVFWLLAVLGLINLVLMIRAMGFIR